MITITIDDNKGNVQTFNLSNAEEKAAMFDMASIKDWLENAIRHKIRQNKIEMIRETMTSNKNLTKTDKTAIINKIIANGEVLKDIKDMSDVVKDEIIKRTKLKKRGK